MTDFDPYIDVFVSPSLAPERAKRSDRDFRAFKRPGSLLPVYRFPTVTPKGATVDRYLASDLHKLAEGALI